MATRLNCLNTATTTISPSVKAQVLAGQKLRLHTSATEGVANTSAVNNTVAGPATTDYLYAITGSVLASWVSDGLAADVNLAGSIVFNVWASENSMSANVAIACKIEVWDYDLSVRLATLISGTSDNVELGTSRTAHNWSATPTAYQARRGDKIVVIWQYKDGGGTQAAGFTTQMAYDGTSGADGDTYVTFTETLTFSSAISDPTQKLYLRDSGPDLSANVDKLLETTAGTSAILKTTDTVSGGFGPWPPTDTQGGTQITWWSKALVAQTLQTGEVFLNIWAYRSSAKTVYAGYRIDHCNAAGTVLATLLDIAYTQSGQLLTTAAAAYPWRFRLETALSISAGDRFKLTLQPGDQLAQASNAPWFLRYAYDVANTAASWIGWDTVLDDSYSVALTLTVDLLDGGSAIYAPVFTGGSFQTLALDALDGSSAIYAPTVVPKTNVLLGLIDAGAAIYTPSVGTLNSLLALVLVTSPSTPYAPILVPQPFDIVVSNLPSPNDGRYVGSAQVIHVLTGSSSVAAPESPTSTSTPIYIGQSPKIATEASSPAQWDNASITSQVGADQAYYRGISAAIHVIGEPATWPPGEESACNCVDYGGGIPIVGTCVKYTHQAAGDNFNRTTDFGLGIPSSVQPGDLFANEWFYEASWAPYDIQTLFRCDGSRAIIRPNFGYSLSSADATAMLYFDPALEGKGAVSCRFGINTVINTIDVPGTVDSAHITCRMYFDNSTTSYASVIMSRGASGNPSYSAVALEFRLNGIFAATVEYPALVLTPGIMYTLVVAYDVVVGGWYAFVPELGISSDRITGEAVVMNRIGFKAEWTVYRAAGFPPYPDDLAECYFDTLMWAESAQTGSCGCTECEDPGGEYDGAQIPPFEPGYMPILRRQIGDPTTTLDSYLCTMESGAMVLDWHTRGAIQVWGGELVQHCGRSVDSIIGSGTNLGDLKTAWAYYGQYLDIRSGGTWTDLIACLSEGRAVVIQGDYGYLPDTEKCQVTFEGNHAISLYPYAYSGRILTGDPLCNAFKGRKETSLQTYAEALGAAVYGTHSPQPILFAVSRPWTP